MKVDIWLTMKFARKFVTEAGRWSGWMKVLFHTHMARAIGSVMIMLSLLTTRLLQFLADIIVANLLIKIIKFIKLILR